MGCRQLMKISRDIFMGCRQLMKISRDIFAIIIVVFVIIMRSNPSVNAGDPFLMISPNLQE